MIKKDAVLVQSRIGLASAVLEDNISQGATANGAANENIVATDFVFTGDLGDFTLVSCPGGEA